MPRRILLVAFLCAGCSQSTGPVTAPSDSQSAKAPDGSPAIDDFEIEIAVNDTSEGQPDKDAVEHRTINIIGKKPFEKDVISRIVQSNYETCREDIENGNSISKRKNVNIFYWDSDKYRAIPRDGTGWRMCARSHDRTIDGPVVPAWPPPLVEWNY